MDSFLDRFKTALVNNKEAFAGYRPDQVTLEMALLSVKM